MKDVLTIDWEMLGNISYQTQLGKTLRNTLRKFNKEELFDEINDIITHYIECDSMIKHDHRIKSIQSCALKYEKYFPSTILIFAQVRFLLKFYHFLIFLRIVNL